MTNYASILNTGIALLLEIVIGFVCIKFKLFPKSCISPINKMDFKIVFLPLMARSFAIRNLYTMNFKPLLASFLMSLTTQIILATMVFFIPFEDKLGEYISLMLPIIYVNYVIIGIPLFDAVWGAENNAITSVIIMSNDLIIVPIYQVLMSVYRFKINNEKLKSEGKDPEKFDFGIFLRVIKNVFLSPIIQGIIIGIIWSLTTLKLPVYFDRLLLTLSSIITACALFCVGGYLAEFSIIACTWYEFIIGMVFRFIIMPLFGCLFSYAIGLSNTECRQVTVLAAVTTAFATYPITTTNQHGVGIASTMIFWSTVFCIPVVMLWLFVFDSLKLFVEP